MDKEVETEADIKKSRSLPFDRDFIARLTELYPTPFYIYDEEAIVENIFRLKNAFSWNAGFQEFFAIKALPNPAILRLMLSAGLGLDCSSLVELLLAERVGGHGERLMFTSNNTPAEEYELAHRLGAMINLDDLTQLSFLEEKIGLPELLSFRYNPGRSRTGNVIIGQPEEAKFGCSGEQLFEGYAQALRKGIKRFGLHCMLASNELEPSYFEDTVRMLLDVAEELRSRLGIEVEFLNMGGGIGIPYQPDQESMNLEALGEKIQAIFFEHPFSSRRARGNGDDLRIYMECGRLMTGPYGYLVTKAIHSKNTYRRYIGVDACMANLMRPGMYGAYHHVTVLGKESLPRTEVYDVVGSLCENNDKFAVSRALPEIVSGDILVIHDAGAHGHSMGFNYNGKLRSAELLLRSDGSVACIRRAETVEDHFSTLYFEDL